MNEEEIKFLILKNYEYERLPLKKIAEKFKVSEKFVKRTVKEYKGSEFAQKMLKKWQIIKK